MLKFSETFEFSKEKFRKIPILKELEWFEWFEWFGPSPIEPFNSVPGRPSAVPGRPSAVPGRTSSFSAGGLVTWARPGCLICAEIPAGFRLQGRGCHFRHLPTYYLSMLVCENEINVNFMIKKHHII